MLLFLIILFALSLVYVALTERVKRFITLLVIQGILLFGIAFFQLRNIDTFHLVLILVETIIVKSIAIPLFLRQIRTKNKLNRLNESSVPAVVSILVVSSVLVFGFMTSHLLHEEHISSKFFSIAISSVIIGIYFIIIHKNVFTHLIGYLIIENGIFLVSLAVGAKMPALVNMAILLDIFISVLVLGIFINRVGDTFDKINIDHLSELRD